MTLINTAQLIDKIIRPAVSSLVRNSNYMKLRYNAVDEDYIRSVIDNQIEVVPVINCINGLRGTSTRVSCPDIGNLFTINSYKNADDVWQVTELNIIHSLENLPRDNRAFFEDAVLLIEAVIYNITGHESYLFKYKDMWYLKYNETLYLCPRNQDSCVSFFLNDETMIFEINAEKTDVIDGMRINPPRNRGSPKTSW